MVPKYRQAQGRDLRSNANGSLRRAKRGMGCFSVWALGQYDNFQGLSNREKQGRKDEEQESEAKECQARHASPRAQKK